MWEGWGVGDGEEETETDMGMGSEEAHTASRTGRPQGRGRGQGERTDPGIPEADVCQVPPKDKRWNHLIGITTKWHRSFFYFVGQYASPGPDALSPTFD